VVDPPKHAIVDFANENKPDALFISSRGLGSVSRFLMGSVSDFVVHNATCPVFVIKVGDAEVKKA